jgi:hypothetical protein
MSLRLLGKLIPDSFGDIFGDIFRGQICVTTFQLSKGITNNVSGSGRLAPATVLAVKSTA